MQRRFCFVLVQASSWNTIAAVKSDRSYLQHDTDNFDKIVANYNLFVTVFLC